MTASPKQPQPEQSRDWYPYYAGFSEDFVAELLQGSPESFTSVLDPWNGSGTTTAVCARHGVRSAGIDINPALTVIARARLTPRSVSESLVPLGMEILTTATQRATELTREDLLRVWMRPDAVHRVRTIQNSIHVVLADTEQLRNASTITARAETLPILACFYYAALFAAIRDLLMRFRASNPTWLLEPTSTRHRIVPNWDTICQCFVDRIEYLRKRLFLGKSTPQEVLPNVRTGSATKLPFTEGSFEAIIGSPPYATRIDYVRSVLPELAVLGASRDDIATLRRTSTGTPVVSGTLVEYGSIRSETGLKLLEKIRSHASKGSENYYYPWMANYLGSLQTGLGGLLRVISTNGQICMVVQDSHYKEIHVDLQQIVTDMMVAGGKRLKKRIDYDVKHHKARMNPRARRHLLDRKNTESLLVFG